MNVLFICRANVGRSQMAEAIFKSLNSTHTAMSAGLNPPMQWLGQSLDKTKFVAPCMAEIGIDVTKQISKIITPEIVSKADIIIVIGERNGWPDYLTAKTPLRYWDIPDPDTGEMPLYREVRDNIMCNIKILLTELDKKTS